MSKTARIRTIVAVTGLAVTVATMAGAAEPNVPTGLHVALQTEQFSGRDLEDGVRTLCGMESRRSLQGENYVLAVGYHFSENLTASMLAGKTRLRVMDRHDADEGLENMFGAQLQFDYPLRSGYSLASEVRYLRAKPSPYTAPSGIAGINSFTFAWEQLAISLGVTKKISDLTAFVGGCYNFSELEVKMVNSVCGCQVIDRRLRAGNPWHGKLGIHFDITDEVSLTCTTLVGGESNVSFALAYTP